MNHLKMKFEKIKRAYFIGIGGIGMSAIARYFNSTGIQVAGYDKTETSLTKKLVEEGIEIHYEASIEALPVDLDIVIFTPAIPDDHLELNHLRNGNVPVIKRAEALGIISRSRQTIAIAGTHGKTTTSSLLTYLLKCGGIDCTAFLGGIPQNFGTNYIKGESDWLVVEADEYDRSFLHLSPLYAAITSMDADHLDIYESLESMHSSGFLAFIEKILEGGRLFIQKDWTKELKTGTNYEDYGLINGMWAAKNIHIKNGYFLFDFVGPGFEIKALQTAMPGRHNIENATVAIAIALQIGISETAIRQGLKTFGGIKRRFEIIHRESNFVYIDDYAHHPSELNAAIGAAKELFPAKKIVGIFQPHLFSRTRDFADGFALALDQLDIPLLLDIYPARELPIEGVSSQMLLQKMQNPNRQLIRKDKLIEIIERSEAEVLLTLGAGDIGAEVEKIKDYLNKRNVG